VHGLRGLERAGSCLPFTAFYGLLRLHTCCFFMPTCFPVVLAASVACARPPSPDHTLHPLSAFSIDVHRCPNGRW
jgi:hypothetical protein